MIHAPDHLMERIAAAKVATYEDALARQPNAFVVHSTVVGLRENGRQSDAAINAHKHAWYARHLRDHIIQPPRSHDPERKLRVGYVSSDFRHHSAAYQFSRILWHHDHDQVEVYCYNLAAPKQRDEMTAQFEQCADFWRECLRATPEALAQVIAADRIDILVDLCGHCPGYALPMFTMKPAPIQLSGFGALSPTMVPEIDFVLSDAIIAPGVPMVELPCALAYQPGSYAPDPAPFPRKVNGYPTFGYLGRLSKVSDACLELWCRAVRDIPNARLVLKDHWIGSEPGFAEALRNRLAAFGMTGDRVDLRPRTLHVEHLAAHNGLDVCLDSLPTNGGITTLEALWMGRPVVSLHDPARLNGRVGRSILTTVGLPELSCDTEAAFIAKCAELAQSKLRLPTRNLLRHSRIVERVAERMEVVYRDLWTRWCAGDLRKAAA